jgi:hypothetical protein
VSSACLEGPSPRTDDDESSSSGCSCFSRPSILFNSASRTSVFGPLFFGTASMILSTIKVGSLK